MATINNKINLKSSTSNPSSPVTGDVYYNSTESRLKVYNGTTFNGVDNGGFVLFNNNLILSSGYNNINLSNTTCTRIEVYSSSVSGATGLFTFRVNGITSYVCQYTQIENTGVSSYNTTASSINYGGNILNGSSILKLWANNNKIWGHYSQVSPATGSWQSSGYTNSGSHTTITNLSVFGNGGETVHFKVIGYKD